MNPLSSAGNRDPEAIWNLALAQLQMELNKTTFDAWVKDVRFVSCDHGVFRLGVVNDMARAWLTDRMIGTTRKVLIGLMGQTTEVEFVVVTAEEPAEEPEEIEPLVVESFWYSHQESEVHPNEGTFVPGYFVHYLPHLKPEDVMVFFAAYRTVLARHLASGGEYAGLPPSRRLSISIGKLCERSGLSRNTVMASLKRAQPGTCLGMLIRSNRSEQRPAGHHTRRPPDLRVTLDLPLLPHHAAHITNMLRSLLAAGKTPADALRTLAAEPYDQLLPQDPDAVRSSGFPQDLSSLDDLIWNEISRFGELTKAEQNEISVCATYLREYILRRNHTFGLTDYLLRGWFKHIQGQGDGAKRGRRPTGALLLLAYLRWLCYCRFERGRVVECRDTTMIRHGYVELAQALGTKPWTVYLWLRETWVQHFARTDWSGLDLDDTPEAGWLSAPRTFRVAMIDPVLPAMPAKKTPVSTEKVAVPQLERNDLVN